MLFRHVAKKQHVEAGFLAVSLPYGLNLHILIL